MNDSKRRNIIVTGASSGIGRAVALRLIHDGLRVIAFDRDVAGLDSLRQDATNEDALLLSTLDISIETAVEQGVNSAIQTVGHIDGLVNCAGIDHLVPISDCTTSAWRKIMSVNLDGTFFMCRTVARHMIERKVGNIVNIASWLAKAGMAGHAPYAASKFAIIGLTQSLAKEVAPLGIRVNAICPGAIANTHMREEADRQAVAQGLPPASERVSLIPLGRLGEPEDIAGVVLFLMSEDARYMTGQAINVTGGLWMN